MPSLVLTAVDRWASQPLTGLTVLAAALVWVAISIVVGFPEQLEKIFDALAASVTLAMLFVIQHTQGRQQAALRRKLDEILHALPDASDAMVRLEHASDDELHAAGASHREVRRAAVDEGEGRR